MKVLSGLTALALFLAAAPASAREERTFVEVSFGGETYAATLETNETARAIAARLPLELTMKRFGGHEFYAELPFRPPLAAERTSKILAGHVYYWDGWNAFVINYIDCDIAPYRVVRVGEIADPSIREALAKAADTITARVR